MAKSGFQSFLNTIFNEPKTGKKGKKHQEAEEVADEPVPEVGDHDLIRMLMDEEKTLVV